MIAENVKIKKLVNMKLVVPPKKGKTSNGDDSLKIEIMGTKRPIRLEVEKEIPDDDNKHVQIQIEGNYKVLDSPKKRWFWWRKRKNDDSVILLIPDVDFWDTKVDIWYE